MSAPTITYPRRKVIRGILKRLSRAILSTLTHFEISGQENLPGGGPLLLVSNHFNYLDPLALIGGMPWTIEFMGGFRMPNAPSSVTWLPRLYGTLPVHRGTVSRQALLSAQSVLEQNGVLGIFPEGGSWASVLRPARPGAALLATRTTAHILPVGLDGLIDVFPALRTGRRAHIQMRIGKPFGPFFLADHGRVERPQLEEIGHEIMRRIADLLPPERRGHYSPDPRLRSAAAAAAIYPWDGHPEQ